MNTNMTTEQLHDAVMRLRNELKNARTILVSVAMQHAEWQTCVNNELLFIDHVLESTEQKEAGNVLH